MDDFSFGDESKTIKYTKTCKEFDSLSYVAAARSDDPSKERYSVLYAFDLDGVSVLAATDGRRVNYAPFQGGENYSVVKQTKTELVLEKLDDKYVELPAFNKVIPRDKDVFHVKPFDVCAYGFRDNAMEFLVECVYRLSNLDVVFRLRYLKDFVDALRSDGKIRILCPRASSFSAWRVEHIDMLGNLLHGTVFMPIRGFYELNDVRSPYAENSGFKEYDGK